MSERYMTYHPDPYVRAYTDRGMAKWLGFYLSEHTTEMEKDFSMRNRPPISKKKMALEEISKQLAYAYQYKKAAEIQLNTLSLQGTPPDSIRGTIEGIDEMDVFVLSDNIQMHIISLDTIQSIWLNDDLKWSDLQ